MKNFIVFLLGFLMLPVMVVSQEMKKDTVKDKPERPAFEGTMLIDNQTNVLHNKNTLEVMMQHRFGEYNGGDNLLGIYGAGNIRIALSYAIHDRLTIGYGTTKFKKYQDFNWKVGLLKQTRSDKIPVSVSYYGNFVIDARRGRTDIHADQDRYSYFNQLIIARRFSPKLSLQLAPSISHYNLAEVGMPNDVVALAFGGRYKVSDQTSILVDYSYPFIHHLDNAEFENDPEPGFGLGVEFSTSGHVFQLFVTSNKGIVPQENNRYNQNDFFKGNGNFLIGFNITRNYNF